MNRFTAKLRAFVADSPQQHSKLRAVSQNQREKLCANVAASQRTALRLPLADVIAAYKASLRKSRATVAALLVAASAFQVANDTIAAEPAQSMQLPAEVRAWYRNPDGSCVQCSIGMCGVWANVPAASTLLWDTEYGPAERRGAWPSRVSAYAASRGIKLYNVTGETTFDWLRWAARTGRFAAMAAGNAHFQTLYGIDPSRGAWQVCNNNSPTVIDDYSEAEFRRLHSRGGAWIVVLDTPAVPMVPVYEGSE